MFERFHDALRAGCSADLLIHVRPHAAKTQLRDVLMDGSFKIDVAAPAEDNRCNAALIRFLAEQFKVPPGSINILSGKTSRVKLVRITAAR